MDTGKKNWATEYLIDPLSAPQPSEEDGPGTSFRPQQPATPTSPDTPKSSSVRSSSTRLTKNNPYRKSLGTPPASGNTVQRSASLNHHKSNPYPSPPNSAGPQSPSYRKDAFGESQPNRRRGSSLTEKYPGDMSHRPLDQLSREKHVANRSRHSTRKHYIQPDTIDRLDNINGSYHHGGPYDATLFARNNSSSGPLGALAYSNAETLKATPHEKIVDSVKGHHPLDGVATYAPGETDRNGHLYTYEQGENMMIDNNPAGGAYKRWPGVQYHPDDIKGKGEPSYSIEKALKEHSLDEKQHGRKASGEHGNATEMKPLTSSGHSRTASGISNGHNRSVSNGSNHGPPPVSGMGSWDDGETPRVKRSGSLSQGLKKRWGSVKRHMGKDE